MAAWTFDVGMTRTTRQLPPRYRGTLAAKVGKTARADITMVRSNKFIPIDVSISKPGATQHSLVIKFGIRGSNASVIEVRSAMTDLDRRRGRCLFHMC